MVASLRASKKNISTLENVGWPPRESLHILVFVKTARPRVLNRVAPLPKSKLVLCLGDLPRRTSQDKDLFDVL